MTTPLAALVDTGSDLTWLPAEALRGAGIETRGTRTIEITPEITVEREVGYVILRANGREIAVEVVFAEPNESVRLGTQALAAFGVKMDDTARRFVSINTLAAFGGKSAPRPFARAA